MFRRNQSEFVFNMQFYDMYSSAQQCTGLEGCLCRLHLLRTILITAWYNMYCDFSLKPPLS